MADTGLYGRIHEAFFQFELLPGVGHEQESPVAALQCRADGVFILHAAWYDLDTGLAHHFRLVRVPDQSPGVNAVFREEFYYFRADCAGQSCE